MYKQKAKQLLWEHQNATAELRMQNTLALKNQAQEVTAHEKVIRDEKNDLKIELRTIELAHQDHVAELVSTHDKKYVKLIILSKRIKNIQKTALNFNI